MSRALALGLNSFFDSMTGVDKEVQLKMPFRPFNKIKNSLNRNFRNALKHLYIFINSELVMYSLGMHICFTSGFVTIAVHFHLFCRNPCVLFECW